MAQLVLVVEHPGVSPATLASAIVNRLHGVGLNAPKFATVLVESPSTVCSRLTEDAVVIEPGESFDTADSILTMLAALAVRS